MFDNRRLVPFGAVAVALVFGAGVIGVVNLARDEPAPRVEPAFAVRPPPTPGVLPNAGALSAHAKPGPVALAQSAVSVRYTFDRGVGQPITDDAGRHPLRPLGQNGGNLSLVPQGPGLAVDYPDRCTKPREGECPRVILEGNRDDSLNPGTRPMKYGASIRMVPSDLSDGANVLQKGYSVGKVSQFKLQVDHKQGRPSCVIAGRNRIYRAQPAIDIADGAWHNVTCARARTGLSITVDGVRLATVPVPPGLSIANAEPLRIGGKGTNNGNDQYAGQIDNVFLTID
jgi:concanavalin A-like lectin/glucanase superfamily protein